MTAFGENLKKIRMARKMSQDEFAALLNTSKQVISRYETGQRSPKVSVVSEYAEILGVSIGELTGDARTPAPADDDDLWTLRESLRDDPNRRMLFHLAKNATKKDVDAAVALIDALKATNPDFYDGDDPS